ncbi:MAG: cation:proton antiporter [Zymomonas mobilis subsp. pomaceae]|uniref:Sodium/hydrogen exchanger n=1 Tax=Zymomonas mobilis subsp. pomaceae (strain ATCC 29192 / DSM 22645 / JCM 10191 / CCUG 17912 / NBRC 13757 / NCIMB 11200 / NRRL B-4491 / Barker I) TaxID=579138 RepID=F8EVB5_ZYMMT|nr:cation:proton antiporter [Zymomonas mobilis]AEI37322.1 sodium/hydrogen exchanger [Zymomonas mobilis subsp. pomaceae ATCC 29192]MDX5948690.1 cation:proton antiporter [Zymomonas mobilis subsp. pomaceae]GEB88495.1 potassium transporter TrkA [Zymomonas mobilis subsp. pomaceae]
MQMNSSLFSDSLVILGAAGLIIPAFARFRVSPVIGFILAGILLGPKGLGSLAADYPWLKHITISEPDGLEPFADFGIVLMLFSIGLELSFKRLWAMRRSVFGLGTGKLLGCGLLIGTGLYILGENWAGAIGMGLALSVSSTALVLPMVGTTGPVGKNAFAILLFEDLALVPIIFALGAMAPYAQDNRWDGLISTLWQGGATVIAILVLGRFALPTLFAQAARTKSSEVFLSISLLVVILASVATSAVGLSPIVGALTAGLLIAETDYHVEVEIVVLPFQRLALGVFLLTVGMSLDLRLIMANWQSLALGVAGVVIVKTIVTAGLLRLTHVRLATATESGLLMSAPSETTLVILATARQAQLVMPSTAAFWEIVTAIGLTITPLLAKIGHMISLRLALREHEVATPSNEEPDDDIDNRTIIAGIGRVGRTIADVLIAEKKPYLAIDSDIDLVINAKRDGYQAMFGDIGNPALIMRLGSHIQAVVLAINDPVSMVNVVHRIHTIYPDLIIIARASDSRHAAQLFQAGATDIVAETLESSLRLAEATLISLGVSTGHAVAAIHEKRSSMRENVLKAAREGNVHAIRHTPNIMPEV